MLWLRAAYQKMTDVFVRLVLMELVWHAKEVYALDFVPIFLLFSIVVIWTWLFWGKIFLVIHCCWCALWAEVACTTMWNFQFAKAECVCAGQNQFVHESWSVSLEQTKHLSIEYVDGHIDACCANTYVKVEACDVSFRTCLIDIIGQNLQHDSWSH